MGLTWVRKAAEAGNEHAMLMLGACLAEGRGAPADWVEGTKWLKKAEAAGLKEATDLLARMEAAANGALTEASEDP